MSFDLIGLGAAANDGTGDSARVGGAAINGLISAANAGQLQGFKNKILNGDFSIWQKGTTFNNITSPTLTADRFVVGGNSPSDISVSQQPIIPGTIAGSESEYYLRLTVNTAGTFEYLSTKIEDVRQLAGKTAVLSFWARTTGGITSLPAIRIQQVFGSGGSAAVGVILDISGTITSTWQKFEKTAVFPSISGKTIGTNPHLWVLLYTNFGSALQTGVLDIADMQLEVADAAVPKATAFEKRPKAAELAMCQRYYQAKTVRSENGSRHISLLPMRAAPTVSVGVGSAANITSQGFELSHSAAADCAVTASAEL
jgi:hypothetical protein